MFRVKDGTVTLLANELTGPNGLAFSPDEKFLYVDNWDPQRKVVMRYPVQRDGTLGDGDGVLRHDAARRARKRSTASRSIATATSTSRVPAACGSIAADGKHLGTITPPRLPANFAWGGDDGRTLYLTRAQHRLYRIDLTVLRRGCCEHRDERAAPASRQSTSPTT